MSNLSSDIADNVGPLDSRMERRHSPTGPDHTESHSILAVADDGRSALAMQVSIHHRSSNHSAAFPSRRAAFHCVVFRDGEYPVVIVENEMPVPADRWEFRTSGLWLDNICEIPFVHWSYGLEAFGLAIEDPLEMLGRGYGDRVPIGWELEFESDPDRYQRPGSQQHRQSGFFHGVLLFADGTQAFEGAAMRYHQWGPPAEGDPSVAVITGAVASTDGPTEVALPTADGAWWVARTEVGLDARLTAGPQQRPPR